MLEIAKARGRATISAQHLIDYKMDIEENMRNGIGELYTQTVRQICNMKIKRPTDTQPPKDRPWDKTKQTTKTTLNKIMTKLYTHIDKAIKKSIPEEVEHSKEEKEKQKNRPTYNKAIALKVAMCRWMRAPTSYTTTYTPPSIDEEQGGIEAAMRLSLHEITGAIHGPTQWTPDAEKHIIQRIKSLALITGIIENTQPPPEFGKHTHKQVKVWRDWGENMMAQASAQLTRTLEREQADQMAKASVHNLVVQENFGKGKYAKAITGAGLSTNGSCVTRPGNTLIEQFFCTSKEQPR
jgi:hypothetical protein